MSKHHTTLGGSRVACDPNVIPKDAVWWVLGVEVYSHTQVIRVIRYQYDKIANNIDETKCVEDYQVAANFNSFC